jgi:hypothetical protein
VAETEIAGLRAQVTMSRNEIQSILDQTRAEGAGLAAQSSAAMEQHQYLRRELAQANVICKSEVDAMKQR